MNTNTLPPQLQAADLAIEIADDYARTDIEYKARAVASNYPMPVYDVSELESYDINEPSLLAADRADIQRAVRYLDLRGLIVRPFSDSPQLVSFPQVGA